MNRTRLCVTVTAPTMEALRARRDEHSGAGLVELRLDTVERPDVRGAQRQHDGIGAVGHAEGVLDVQVLRQRRFELLEILLQDVGATAQHVAHQGHELLLIGALAQRGLRVAFDAVGELLAPLRDLRAGRGIDGRVGHVVVSCPAAVDDLSPRGLLRPSPRAVGERTRP